MTRASRSAIFGTTLGVAGIFANGTPEQLLEWVPQCFGTPDDIKLAAFCVSEADAGSDVSNLKTRAVYDEASDTWTINGTKTWITNGGIADIHVVVASVDPALGSRGQASFIVPPKTPGLSQGQKFKKMGIRASHTAEVVLEDVKVPGSCCSAERRSSTSASHGPARGSARRRRRRWRPSRRAGRRWPRRRSASPVPPTSTRSTTPRSAGPSAGRSSRTRGSPSSSPT